MKILLTLRGGRINVEEATSVIDGIHLGLRQPPQQIATEEAGIYLAARPMLWG